ncbi:hypothetical protein QYE76_050321 [Lolium multiflorum]|uniref:Transposase (putative) gypsy type domain-containing protein n=1 Tax=Lolium multiflorum TaxID=4521 RepID=A0AAD8SRD9_LOLMU|nr:hypothetical protein QYE76_050321 [Lolium multiflorum]
MAAADLGSAEWERSKITNQDINLLKKLGISKKPKAVCFPSEESYPTPPMGYRVSFVDHLIRGLSAPIHPFLRGLLFVYGLQLHHLTPNSILHISIFITLCEAFLGVQPNWALWKRIFFIRRNGSPNVAYNIGGVVISVRSTVNYFDVKLPDSVQGWRKKWLYIREENHGCAEDNIPPFDGAEKILRRRSWDADATEEEKASTEALMTRIHELQNTRGKELSAAGGTFMSITLGAATKLLDDMMINYSEWHTERAPQGKKVNSVEETSSLSDKIDVIMSMLVNGRSNVDPNNVPLASLVAQEENVDVNFIKNNNFNNNAYRNNSGNNYRPYPSANGNGYGNSYGNSYNNNRSVPSGLEAMLKEFISTQTAFNKSVEEKLDKIDILASRVDRLASDVNLLKLKVMPNNDIDNKITTANAIQVRINENIRLMAELRARWDREENEKLAKENNVAKVWTITTISNDNDSHVAAPPTINGRIIGVGNVSTPSAKRTKLPEIAKTAETACDKTAEIFSNLGDNDPIAVAHNDLDFDDCHISEVIKFLQKLAKSPNASAINLAFTKHITNALIKAREEKLKLETSIPRKLEDGWEPIIKMKFNDFECNVLCDLGASISVMPKKIYDMLDLPPLKNCYLDVNLADNVKKKPLGRIDNVRITVNNNLVPVDFVVLDIECNASCPIVLGRPFLRTVGAVIDMREDSRKSAGSDEKEGASEATASAQSPPPAVSPKNKRKRNDVEDSGTSKPEKAVPSRQKAAYDPYLETLISSDDEEVVPASDVAARTSTSHTLVASETPVEGEEISPPQQNVGAATPPSSPLVPSPKRVRVETIPEPTLQLSSSSNPLLDDPTIKELLRIGAQFIGYRDYASKTEEKLAEVNERANTLAQKLEQSEEAQAREGIDEARTGLSRLFPYFFPKKEEPATFLALAKCFNPPEDLGLKMRHENMKVAVESTVALVADSQQTIDWAKVGDTEQIEQAKWRSLIKAAKLNTKKILSYLGIKPSSTPSSSRPEV